MKTSSRVLIASIVIVSIVILLLALYCYEFHPNWCHFLTPSRTSNSNLIDLPVPTVEEPTTTNKNQISIGVYPGDPQTRNGEISLPSGPSSFDVARDAIAIADPVHLGVVVGQSPTSNGAKTNLHWSFLRTDFPPVRVRLKEGHFLIQEYEGSSDNDLVCTTNPLHCDVIAEFYSKPTQLAQLRRVRDSILQVSAPVPSLVQVTENLGGSSYLGKDGLGNTYYLVDYIGPAAAREGAFHFRKYSRDGTLADESPPLPEDNDVRILDRARSDDDGVCYWLSVQTDGQARTMLRAWRAK